MEEQKGQPEGDNIEELLSQLKGIFGHLSDTEKEESKQKITPPYVAPKPLETPEFPSASPVAPILSEPTPSPLPEPMPALGLAPLEAPMPSEVQPLDPFAPTEAAVVAPLSTPEGFTPSEAFVPVGTSLIPTMVFYPAGRLAEAKILAEKLERITPKFTKIPFVLNVQAMTVYDVKADLKNVVGSQMANSPMKAVFLLIDKGLDDARRKAVIAELEPRGIYFQDVPIAQVEKKALYTDMLLGLVFFFDSQKTTEPGQ